MGSDFEKRHCNSADGESQYADGAVSKLTKEKTMISRGLPEILLGNK